MKSLYALWRDETGGLNSCELIILATILMIGVIPGVAALRNAIVLELGDLAYAVSHFHHGHGHGHDHDDDDHPGRGRARGRGRGRALGLGRGRGRGLGRGTRSTDIQLINVCADAVPES